MTRIVRDEERDQREWNRQARDAVNTLSRRLLGSGTTAERPPRPVTGQMYYDTTLARPIWRDAGGAWRDAGGTAV